MIVVLVRWLFLWLTLFFIGRNFLNHFLEKKDKNSFFVFPSIWLGLALLIAFLQIISLVLPINSFWVIVLWLILFIISIFSFTNYKKLTLKLNLKLSLFLVLSVITIILGLYFSIGMVYHYDTYLYNFNAVAWSREFSVVPGLANLHSRLGFNSSFNLFAAFTEFGLNSGYSVFIANGFLLVTVATQYLHHIFNSKSKIFHKLIMVFLLPFVYLLLVEGNLSSLSTDLAMYSVILAWMGIILIYPKFKFLILAIAVLALVFKLSSIFVLFFSIYFVGKLDKLFLRSVFLSFLIIFGFMLRSLFISGYPLYPNTFFKTNFTWSLPINEVKNQALEIKAWARMPGDDYMSSLNQGFAYWWPQWWQRASSTSEIKILFFSCFILGFFASFKKWNKTEFLVLLLCISSILFIFYQAPDLRFARVFFWILGALSLASLIVHWKISDKNKLNFAYLILVLLFGKFVFPTIHFMHQPTLFLNELNNFKKIQYKSRITKEGQDLYVPVIGDQCGNSPLPCTPYFNENLKFIKLNDFRYGFKL